MEREELEVGGGFVICMAVMLFAWAILLEHYDYFGRRRPERPLVPFGL